MAAREPISLDKLRDIPDPARGIAERPAPPPVLPTGPSATRVDRRRRVAVVLLLAAAWLAGVLWLTGLRRDLGSIEVLVPLGGWLAAAALGLLVATRPRPRGMPPGVRALDVVIAGVPLAYAATVLSQWVSAPDAPGTPPGARCASFATTITAGLLALASLLMYRSFPSAPARRGAAIGAVCGLAGAVGVHAHCPAREGGHVLFAHGLSIALGALLGGLFGALRGRV